MNWILTLLIGFFTLFSCNNVNESSNKTSVTDSIIKENDKKQPTFGIVIHGGAGTILKENMTDSLEIAYQQKLEEAIRVGHEILKNGGSAMQAVTKTINILEDSPLFNAGKGAVFTHEETNELDASVMDGSNLNAGAVAGVTRIKNPINLALEVMNNSPHVLLAGKGAENFAQEKGFEMMEPSYFYTENRFQSLQQVKAREIALRYNASNGQAKLKHSKNSSGTIESSFNSNSSSYDPYIKNSKFGTVGCAALDKNGNLAAGTSTGGMTNKRWNRIGDAPIIGAGTYANNATCAVSSTGWGEYFIRAMVAHDISAMMEYKGISLEEAAVDVIQNKVPELGGNGGIVAIDKDGNVSMEFNTAGMYRAHMNAAGVLVTGIYGDD